MRQSAAIQGAIRAGTRRAPLPPVAVIGSDWSATLATVESLGARGVPITVYGPGAARWSRHVRRGGACPPPEDLRHFLPWLRERVVSGEIERLAPTTDLLAWCLAELRPHFRPEVRRAITPLVDVEDALDKTRFATRAAGIGLPVPDTRAPVSVEGAVAAARELGYPLVMKPRSHMVVGHEVRGRLILDESMLRACFAPLPVYPGHEPLATRYPDLRWPMLQRYLPAARGAVVSVAGFRDPVLGVLAAGVSCKLAQWPAHVGTSIVQRSWSSPEARALALATLPSMLSVGIFELELVQDGNGWLAIDLNPRAFGFMRMEIARGNDLPWLWYRASMADEQRASLPHADDHRNGPAGNGAIEARDLAPYLVARLRGRLPPGVVTGVPRDWVPMLPLASDPLAGLIGLLKLLRHPRSLLRACADAPAPASVVVVPPAQTVPPRTAAPPSRVNSSVEDLQ